MAWNDTKSNAIDPENPTADEQLTATEWNNHVTDQNLHIEANQVVELTNKTIDTASNTLTVVAADVTDFDTEVANNTAVALNTAKETNATHTGDVTGDEALTIASGAIDIAMHSATGTPSSANFLRGDNTWSTPAGSGDVSKVGTPVDNQVGVWTGDGTIEGTSGFTYDGSALGITGNITLTGTVDGIDIATDVAANTAKTGVTTQISNVSEDTTPQLGGELDAQANSIGFTAQSATGDGTTTIDWGNGNKFNFTFGAFNETFTFTAPAKPGNFVLKMIQDATGSRTATWPATVKWAGGTAPTLTTDASAIDIVSFYYDGTNYFGVASLDFS